VIPSQLDPDWIPKIVLSAGWSSPATGTCSADLRNVRRFSGARHVRLDPSKRQLTKWDQLEILMIRWRSIEAIDDEPCPWVYSVSRTRLRKDL
jgi:hypothetical protein